MNLREKLKQAVYWALIGVLLSAFALQAQAACTFFDAFQDNKDGTVTDPRNGLIWKRCAEGFDWVGAACVGNRKDVNWFDAMKIAKKSRFINQSDWRIPTKFELEQVVGNHSDCKSNDYRKVEYAASSSIAHAVREDKDPGTFWSTTPYVGFTKGAWVIGFDGGSAYQNLRADTFYVRLVRAGNSSGNYASSEFQREYSQLVAPTMQNRDNQIAKVLKTLDIADFSDLERLVKKMQEISYPAVIWKVSNQVPGDVEKLYSSKLLEPNEYVMVALASLLKTDQKPQPVSLPSAPSTPRDLVSRKTELNKGEFESSAQFSARQTAADAAAQSEFDRDQRAFEASKRDYAAVVKQQADAQSRALADSKDPGKNKALVIKHLQQAVALALGNPVLSDISYDADKQVFNAALESSRGTFSQQVTISASQTEAPKLKQDLLSQKIAPTVTLQLPSLVATLLLQENTALRTERFEQASNSAKMLLELIAEYPNSAEANAARKRIPVVQREAYDIAVRSNSSSAYESFISDFAGADTQRLLPQAQTAKQVAAQREERERQAKEAQERRDQAARDEQYRRDAPAREARARASQMCEAQKQSCLASCPAWRSGINNDSHFSCNSRCNGISCY